MKFGAFDHIDANGMPLREQYEQRLGLIGLYEEFGFYCYHLAEHHATRLGMASASSVFLSAAAQRTSRIKLGPLVYLLPLHHPLRLLEEIGMLDQLSGGRLQLGIGPGGQAAEHARFGLERDQIRPMFEEVLDILLKGLASDVLDHEGTYYQLKRVPQLIKPIQQPHPPLWYGTSSPDRAEWAARHRVNLVSLLPNARARVISDALRRAWTATGEDEARRPFMGLARQLIVAESDDDARELASRRWPAFALNFNWLVNQLGIEPFPFPATFDDAVRMGIAFAGSPQSVRDWISVTEEEAGIDYMLLEMVFGDMTTEEATRSITLFGREILPTFT